MGLFDIFKKSVKSENNDPTRLIYELLFCDNLELYKGDTVQPLIYPWDVLFSDAINISDLEKITLDDSAESRVKILAYNKLIAFGQKVDKKQLLGVIVEIGFDHGVDVLASYADGIARYINQSGKMIIWDAPDNISTSLTNNLFNSSNEVVKKIGPWDKPRRAAPTKGVVRITFLVSDGLYFGEGPVKVLFNDPLAAPALASAAELMKYLMEKAQ